MAQRGRAGPSEQRPVRQRPLGAGVEQFVQQQRMRCHALGQERAAGDQVDQPLQRAGLLVQQGQVGAAAQDVVHQRKQPAHRLQRPVGRGTGLQQQGHHPVQPCARGVRQVAHAGRAGEVTQRGVHRRRITKAGRGQHLGITAVGQRAPVAADVAVDGRFVAALGQQGLELACHPRAVRLQFAGQRVPVAVSESTRDPQPVQRLSGHGVHLRIVQHLQPVLQPAQEAVGRAKLAGAVVGNVARFGQRGQRRLQPRLAQRRLAAAADQLQHLGQELDLADAAGPALDVVGQLPARHLGRDRSLHRPQAVERAIVEIPPVHERLQLPKEVAAGLDVTRHRPRLLPGVALPVPALGLEVVLHGGKAQRHPPGAAERAQAQVHPVAEAVGGDLVQQLRQRLAKPGEILLRGQRAGAVAFPRARVGVNQVHVGAEVQLLPAELAQREHHQPHLPASSVADHAVAAGELLLQRVMRQLQAAVGQAGAAGQGVVDVVQAQHVAPDQAGGFGGAVQAQLAGPVLRLIRLQGWNGQRGGPDVGQQGLQQAGLALQGVDGEVAGDGDPAQALIAAGRIEPPGLVAQRQAQAFQRASGKGVQAGTGVFIVHAAHCGTALRAGDRGPYGAGSEIKKARCR